MDIYQLSTGAITAIGVSLLVIFGVVGLILWNNKSKEQVRALKSIDAKIREGAQLSGEKATAEAAVVVEINADGSAVAEVENCPVEEQPVLELIEAEEEKPAETEPEIAFAKEKVEEIRPEIMENNYNVARSGRVYSKSELLQLIRS